MSRKTETAVFGGGCFWCTEAVFEQLRGVLDVESGYAGGKTEQPSYEAVCSGNTGHAEVVRVHFDPSIISFDDLLRVFFLLHDPTTPNRQGPDTGSQYRSVIFYNSEEQHEAAKRIKNELESRGTWERAVVTEFAPLAAFYPAESYHQDFYRNNPGSMYCVLQIPPKLEKLREKFPQLIQNDQS